MLSITTENTSEITARSVDLLIAPAQIVAIKIQRGSDEPHLIEVKERLEAEF
jgi:hypothetical protein